MWTILPSLLYPNLPLDLIEALTYGREWQLGYDKLPPLPWWLVEIVYRLGGADFAYYLLAQLCVLAESPAWALHQPDEVLDSMDSWNKGTHKKSGRTMQEY